MPKTTMRMLAVVAVIILIAFMMFRPPSAKKFKASDPAGYAACEAFEQAEGSGGKYYHEAIRRAAHDAANAREERIRNAVDTARPGVPVIRSLADFKRACKKSGYRFS